MDVYIETYRGFKIFFNKERQAFYVEAELLSDQDRKSFSACRSAIDDFLKNSANFVKFKVQKVASGEVILITGNTKDGRFFYEEDGKKKTLSKYYLDDYILWAEELQEFFNQKLDLESRANEIMREISELRDAIKQNGTLLSNYSLEAGIQ